MHILFLTDNFAPEVNAPASRSFEHCREWVEAGHQVTVITGAPNFPLGIVFPGYRNRLWQTEDLSGIRVIRIWTFIAPNEGFFWRTLDFLSFMLVGFLASLLVRRVDAVIGTSPQFFTVWAAWAASLVHRAPFIFELRDLWPDSVRAVGILRHRRLLDLIGRAELFLYRRAAQIVVVTHSFKRILVARGIDPQKIAVVTNGVDLKRFLPLPKDKALEAELGLQGCFVAGYIGTHGMAHGLDTVLDAARQLRNRNESCVRILMLGSGSEKKTLKVRAKDEGLTNVLFLDTVNKGEVVRYWSLLDLSIIHLRRDPLFRSVIPSKLFEAMATGTPVLLGVEGEAAQIVTRHEVGVALAPDDAACLAQTILALRDDPYTRQRYRENGMRAARRFARPVLALSMLSAIEGVVQDARASEPRIG